MNFIRVSEVFLRMNYLSSQIALIHIDTFVKKAISASVHDMRFVGRKSGTTR